MSDTIQLFHVTPSKNIGSILDAGIAPQMAKGKRKVVWLVDSERVLWAIAHVSVRYKLDVNHIAVFAVTVRREDVARWPQRGLYTSALTLKPNKSTPASSYAMERG